MADLKRAAHELYLKCLGTQSDITAADGYDLEQKVVELRNEMRMLILQFLCNCMPQERFKFQEFPNIILQSSSMEFFEPIKASEAFTNLESYIILLCIMPWKQEFHQIKKYGGFYQTKIESHLKNADSIFKLIGFNETSAGLLVLSHSTKLEFLQYVAFECFVASTECHITENVWRRVFDRGLTITGVVQIRQQNRGTEDDVVALIELKYGKSVIKGISENVVDSRIIQEADEKRSILSGQSLTDPFRNKLENYMQKAKKLSDFEDIPFIDEGVKENEYTPINLDEQILASLQLVEGKNVSPAVSEISTPGLKASQEWSFVREGLEKNYGKKYFEGPRKDILENEPEIKPHSSKQGKYVKVLVENPDPGYVNSDVSRQLKKIAHQHELGNNPLYSVSKDSDYATGTGSEAFFPPTIDSSSQSMRTRGNRQVTDTILTKGSGVHYPAPDANRYSKTEPILRRQQVPVEQIQNAYNPYNTQSHQARQTYGYTNANSGLAGNMDNIQKYQKRTSAPLVQTEKVDPTKFLPVVTSEPMLSGTRSFSEVTKRNTADGMVRPGSRTIHNMPQQNIPVQTKNLMTQNTVNPQWACPYCTYFNNPLTDVCEMCSKSRDPNMEIDSPPCAGYTSRICDQCTLENEKGSMNCHACGHELSRTQTVV
ncbi:uncharacterized protein LOC123548422 [Mercenaria mercenaria]|uniref:uncharacterized protein LOC123548422 n=1 Tax=Mercenaria mercenaria TaxID=6596 RepID=UPI00234EF376|nr:uncharacterized protein LOC123548422 [Mercenaria mercenaria]XP_045191609.2 uncharacterized protein LOC123548422 [Mercenaria mercenaria]XP_045191610.2 uncharacterized protein LOC123548422 [Mercenaria mercenaria]XP_045191611.2 uncharacterized protein LOC123548422 [Mercenaria mercenaria]XP_045191613.2 uncharacterized protein LOC123548422 [Mercenaria mercenaria]